jgi:hypothetical protein
LLVAHGSAYLRRAVSSQEPIQRSLSATPLVALAIAAAFVVRPLTQIPATWATYRSAAPLDAQHATFVRLPASQANVLSAVGDSLGKHCSAYFSLPGMGTFNALADLPIATGYNGTIWTALFDDQDQQRVVKELQQIDGLCILRSERTLRFWTSNPLPTGPLVRYIDEFTDQIDDIDGYVISVRPD